MNEKDLLIKKLEQELKDFKEYVKENGVDYAIDSAYEITVRKEILDTIVHDKTSSKEQIKALLKSNNVLKQCYDEWLKRDRHLREVLDSSVDDVLNNIEQNYIKEKIKTNKEAR